MKTLVIIASLLLLSSCARATFSYEGGKLTKQPRLRPNHDGYAIGFVIGYEGGQQFNLSKK